MAKRVTLKVSATDKAAGKVRGDIHAFLVNLQGRLSGSAAAADRTLGGYFKRLLKSGRLKKNEAVATEVFDNYPSAAAVVLMGTGKSPAAEDFRQMAGSLRKEAENLRASRVIVSLKMAGDQRKSARNAAAFLEGFRMAGYSFDELKSSKSNGKKKDSGPFVRALVFADIGVRKAAAVRSALRDASAILDAQDAARDLQNFPPNILYPAEFARRARTEGGKNGVKVTVFNEKKLYAIGAGAFLAVGRGAAHKPRMVVMKYAPKSGGKLPEVVLIGKGLCFDSGGISIKSSSGMEEMKFDMSGAAAVYGAVIAAAKLKIPVKVTGILGLAENKPSAEAYLPGDVVRAMDGTSIEVINTDAEGRMVLADCLAYAKKKYPKTATIDLATLTGACVIALGNQAAGLFTRDKRLEAALLEAGETSGEKLWPLPMFEDYEHQLESNIADIKHVGGRQAGAVTAALFLARFAPDNWAHLDIAGTAWTGGFGGDPGKSYLNKNLGTGYGVRLLVEFLKAASK